MEQTYTALIDVDDVRDWRFAGTFDQLGKVTDLEHDEVFYIGLRQTDNHVYIEAQISVEETIDYIMQQDDPYDTTYHFDDATYFTGFEVGSVPVTVDDLQKYYWTVRSEQPSIPRPEQEYTDPQGRRVRAD